MLSTHKTRWVVISDSLGIAKGLKSWITLNDLILQSSLENTTFDIFVYDEWKSYKMAVE